MSWYNSIVLSFACDEFEQDGDATIETCQALRALGLRWVAAELGISEIYLQRSVRGL